MHCLDSNVFVDTQRPSGRHCWKLPAEVSAAVANRVSNRVLLAPLFAPYLLQLGIEDVIFGPSASSVWLGHLQENDTQINQNKPF